MIQELGERRGEMAIRRPKGKRAGTRLLRTVAKRLVRDVVPAIEEMLSPFLAEGERLPDLALFAALVVRRVEWRLERFEEAERANVRAHASLRTPRRARDEACGELREILSKLRDVDRCLSRRRPGRKLVTLPRTIPQQPHHLLRCAELAYRELLGPQPGLVKGTPITVEPARLGSELRTAAGALRKALDEIEAKSIEAPRFQEAKMRAKAGFEADCASSMRILGDLGLLAGKREVVGWVRRSKRGRGR